MKITFKWYLHDSKESVVENLMDKGFKEETARKLRYSFYEVGMDCEYRDGEIYVTHFEGQKLEQPAKVGELNHDN